MTLRIVLTFCLLLVSVSGAFGQPRGRRVGAQPRRLDGKGGDVNIMKPRAGAQVKPGAAQGKPIRDGTSNTVKPGAAKGTQLYDSPGNDTLKSPKGARLADDTVGAGASSRAAKPVTGGTSSTVKPGAAQGKPIRDGTSNTVKPSGAQAKPIRDGTSNTVKPGAAQGNPL